MSDSYYMRKAYKAAEDFSTDPSTQNGAILVSARNEIVVAANHFPRGIEETEERWKRPLKYKFVEHSERNVVYKAAFWGISTEGATLYCPWVCCEDCARAIIQSGIVEVVGHDLEIHSSRKDWEEAVRLGREMLEDAGVHLRFIKGVIGGVKIRFGGTLIEP